MNCQSTSSYGCDACPSVQPLCADGLGWENAFCQCQNKATAQNSGITAVTENAPIPLLNMSRRRNIKGTRAETLPERFQTRDARGSVGTEIIQVVPFYIYGNSWCLPLNQPWTQNKKIGKYDGKRNSESLCTAQQKPLRIQAKNRTARLRLGELAHSWQWLTEYPPSLKVCMCNVSWVFSLTYKHPRVLSQGEVSSRRILPNTCAQQPYLTGMLTVRWPRFVSWLSWCQQLRLRMLSDGRSLASGKMHGSSCLLDQSLA